MTRRLFISLAIPLTMAHKLFGQIIIMPADTTVTTGSDPLQILGKAVTFSAETKKRRKN